MTMDNNSIPTKLGGLSDIRPDIHVLCNWKNGKFGAIACVDVPDTYYFIEYNKPSDSYRDITKKYENNDDLVKHEQSLAGGFVGYWLTKIAQNKYDCKEIYDSFIEEEKTMQMMMLKNRPGSWKIEDQEVYVMTNMFPVDTTRASIQFAISKLSDYLVGDDIAHLQAVCDDFLDYLEHTIAQYTQKQAEAKEDVKPQPSKQKTPKPVRTASKQPKKQQKKQPTVAPVKSIEPYATFKYNNTQDSRLLRIILFHQHLTNKLCWIDNNCHPTVMAELLSGKKSDCLIKWICNDPKLSILAYLFHQLVDQKILSCDKLSLNDILSHHFVDSDSVPISKQLLGKVGYRTPIKQAEDITALIEILNPANKEIDRELRSNAEDYQETIMQIAGIDNEISDVFAEEQEKVGVGLDYEELDSMTQGYSKELR